MPVGAAAPFITGRATSARPDLTLSRGGVLHHTPSTWGRWSNGRASRGYFAGSNTTGQTAYLSFSGTWVGLGFLTTTDGGRAEVFIDGVSRGVVDNYSRYEDVASVYYRDLAEGAHTISITVLSTRNPSSNGNWVRLDYIDTWRGDMADGSFEENDRRVIPSGNWTQDSYAGASSGQYFRDGSNVWFPFTGDAVTYQALAVNWGGEVEVLVDGQMQGRVSVWNSTTVTRTYSFGNLGDGPHVLQVRAYRGRATVDAFITPGTPPFYQPPTRSGIVRYEEDDAALRYNDVAYAQMPQTWNVWNDNSWLSDGYGVWTDYSDQTVSLTFTGTWAGFGYLASTNGGQVEVLIDGVSQGNVDTYARSTMANSTYYPGLSAGQHTLTIRTLGTRNPNSSGTRFHFDFFDAWDGSSIPSGTSETPFASTWNWTDDAYAGASGGRYYRDGTAMWFPFTGDAMTYQTLAVNWGGEVEVLIDGQLQGRVSVWNSTTVTRTYAFGDLGTGPHMLQVRAYRGRATVDTFVTPGTLPYYQPPTRSGIVRHEEDDPALRYNDAPPTQMPQTWNPIFAQIRLHFISLAGPPRSPGL